jgi:hypothetical protein
VAEGAASGAGEGGGAAAGDAAGGAADATGEFTRVATAGGFFLTCFFPADAGGAARSSTKTGFGANFGEPNPVFPSERTEMVCG